MTQENFIKTDTEAHSDSKETRIDKETRAQITRKALNASLKPKFTGLLKPPVDYLEQIQLGYELVQFVIDKREKNELVMIDDFALSKFINPYRFRHMADDNTAFAELLQIANYAIGSGLLKSALKREIDPGLTSKILPMYLREYKDEMIEMAKIKMESEAKSGIVYVEVAAIPSNNMVKERKIENNE